MSDATTITMLASIEAKGVGAVLVIFGVGVLVGILLMALVALRLRRGRKRRVT